MSPFVNTRATGSGGRMRARRIVLLAVVMAAAAFPARATVEHETVIRVSEDKGNYTIAAEFFVPQSAAVATAVLSDYEAIPRFMPDMKSSRVIERGDGYALIEQEAVARLMMFSKRIQLLLEVDETPGSIKFRDRSGKSFSRYEGAWGITERNGRAAITYDVVARPAFDVPEFILKRLLKRDATRMIENLRTEIANRAKKNPAPGTLNLEP